MSTLRTDSNLRTVLAALFFWSFGIGLYEQLVPIYARQLGASAVQLGTLYTLRHIALAVGFIIGWSVVDRYPRRTVMRASWVGGAPVPLLLAAAQSYIWLLPGLLLYEVTFFGLPALHAYVTQRVRSADLAPMFALMGTVSSVAFFIAPGAGGLIADRLGIRTTLFLASAFYLTSTVLMLRVKPDPAAEVPAGPARRPTRADLEGLIPVLWITAGMTLVWVITVPFVSPYLREVRGLSLSYIGFLGSMQAVGGIVLTAIAGRLGNRYGVIPTLAQALGVYAVGMLFIVFGPIALLAFVAPLRARAPTHSLGQALIGSKAPADVLGRAFAIAGALSAIVSAVGVFLSGYAYRANPALPLLISIALAVLLGLVMLRMRTSAQAVPQAESAPSGAR